MVASAKVIDIINITLKRVELLSYLLKFLSITNADIEDAIPKEKCVIES